MKAEKKCGLSVKDAGNIPIEEPGRGVKQFACDE